MAEKKADKTAGDASKSRPGVLKVHHLRPVPGAHTAKTRVGRGQGSKGKTAGRGTKGTGARKNTPENFEGGQMPLHMRLPKLRGFKNPFRVEYQIVNVARLAELYPDGGEVTPADLVAKGAVRDGDSLVAELMQALAARFSDHKGRLEEQWQRGSEPETEELRLALQQYRSFFQRLLST